MSPSNFNNNGNANTMVVDSAGTLNGWNNVNNGYGVRPISYYKLVSILMNRDIILVTAINERK